MNLYDFVLHDDALIGYCCQTVYRLSVCPSVLPPLVYYDPLHSLCMPPDATPRWQNYRGKGGIKNNKLFFPF
uniref:Uncharacterized protein n=1 Tax=Anguilla anguilla TaxID=7936 RepID=A0A0E9WQX7_ANGAN